MSENHPGLFQAIAENLSLGMYVLQDEKAIFLNATFAQVFAYPTTEQLIGRNMFNEIYPDSGSVELFKSMHTQIIEKSIPTVSWAQLSARADGTPFWLEVEAKKIDIDGKPAILGTFVDQTDCQYMAEAMVVSQQTLRRLLDAMEDRVYVVTPDYKIIYANRKMLETSLGNPEENPCHAVCRGLDQPCDSCLIDQVLEGGKPHHKEFYNHQNDTWYSSIEIPVRMPGVAGMAKLAVARDITVRKKNEERIRALSHRLISAQEEERRTLSRDLHDDLGQRLNAAKIATETLSQDITGETEEINHRLGALSDILQNSIESVRNLSYGLRPSSLERLGLVETLRNQCDKTASLHGLNTHFQAIGTKDLKLDPDIEINLYRIAQEALNNVVKHADATEVSIKLIASFPSLRLKISDNGKGFDGSGKVNEDDESHFGLLGMAERVELIGGSFRIRSVPGQGTTVSAEIPVSDQIREEKTSVEKKTCSNC